MSESGSLVTSGSSFGQFSLAPVTAGNQQNTLTPNVNVLPKLPSHRFRYTVWHELSSTRITGDQLKAPRVRDGPEIKDRYFYKIRDDSCHRIHHDLHGRERKNYQNAQENWENVQVANLSYQELQHRYQRINFERVLKRLIRVEHLSLLQNEAVDLSRVTLPCCRHLNLSANYIPTLKNLPKLPRIEQLNLSDNYIRDLKGLSRLAHAPLTELWLRANPVNFTLNYRQRVFEILPNLELLDGIPRLPEDAVFETEPEVERDEMSCVIA